MGINVGSIDGDMEGALVGALGIAVGDDVGEEGVLVGITLGMTVGNDVGMVVPVGSHSNTYLSYELKAILDITIYSNSPLKGYKLSHPLPICPVDTLGIFLAELTNVFIATLSLYIVRVLVLVS